MKIIQMDIEDIKPYKYNPRVNNSKAIDKVAESIKEFGFRQPLVIDKDNNIIVGHTRLKAAKKLKVKSLPVVIADDMTEQQIKAYRIADNKTNEYSEWDFALLAQELESIEMFTGFEDDEISNILNGLGTDIINDNDNNGSGSGDKKEHICPECGCKF
jgi:ParB/RepB/Spo0J family partition protein